MRRLGGVELKRHVDGWEDSHVPILNFVCKGYKIKNTHHFNKNMVSTCMTDSRKSQQGLSFLDGIVLF